MEKRFFLFQTLIYFLLFDLHGIWLFKNEIENVCLLCNCFLFLPIKTHDGSLATGIFSLRVVLYIVSRLHCGFHLKH